MSSGQPLTNLDLCCLADLENDLPLNLKADFVSCICTSQRFFHLRWKFFDDDPEHDNGLTLCGRKRREEKQGFWDTGTLNHGRCGECYGAVVAYLKDCETDAFLDLVHKKLSSEH